MKSSVGGRPGVPWMPSILLDITSRAAGISMLVYIEATSHVTMRASAGTTSWLRNWMKSHVSLR